MIDEPCYNDDDNSRYLYSALSYVSQSAVKQSKNTILTKKQTLCVNKY